MLFVPVGRVKVLKSANQNCDLVQSTVLALRFQNVRKCAIPCAMSRIRVSNCARRYGFYPYCFITGCSSNPPFSASNSLDLEPQEALLRGSFCFLCSCMCNSETLPGATKTASYLPFDFFEYCVTPSHALSSTSSMSTGLALGRYGSSLPASMVKP